MSSNLPQNTRTSKFSSLRGVIHIPVKHENTKMNGDNHHQNNDLCWHNSNDNLAEFGQNHPYGKTLTNQGAGPYVSGDEDHAGRHSMVYLEGHEDDRSSGSPSPASTQAYSSTRMSNSQPRLTLSASSDATRSRHVPRGPVARTATLSDKSKSPCQKTFGESKSITNALLNGTQTGVAVLGFGVGVNCTDTAKSKPDTPHKVSADTARKDLDHTSPTGLTMKTKQQLPMLPRLHANKPQHDPAPIRPLARPPLRDINTPPVSSNELHLISSFSVSSGTLEVEVSADDLEEQQNSDWKSAAVRPIVRPLPALPCESPNGIGSASKCGPRSSTAISTDSLISPRKENATPSLSMDPNDPSTESRPASISQISATLNAHSPHNRLQATDSMTTTNKDQSQVGTSTATVPIPLPRRSMTLGVPQSRDPKLPSLSIPPLDRHLSLRGLTEGRARFSPSIIIRPPPLPLTNLPVLTTPRATVAGAEGGEGSNEAERRQSRLMMSMPALPLQGSSRGTKGHEEVDDLEDEEDEDEEDEDEDERVLGQSSASSSSRIETPRSSLDSEMSMDEAEDDVVGIRSTVSISSQTLSRSSSYETARGEPSPVFWDAECPSAADIGSNASVSTKMLSCLPEVDGTTSSADIDFNPSTILDRKSIGKLDNGKRSIVGPRNDADHVGTVVKAKARQELGDVLPVVDNLGRLLDSKGGDRGLAVGTHTTGGSGSKAVAAPDMKVAHDYDSERLERRVGSGSGRSRLNFTNPSSKNGVSAPLHLEPLRVAGLTAMKEKGSILVGLRPGDRAMRSNNSFSSASTTPLASPKLMSSRVGGGIGHYNEMYKRASRSLIDVHAIETKERVEKMVRDREEEEERKRSMKMGVSSRKASKVAVSREKGKQSEAKEGWVEEKTPNLESGKRTAVSEESSIYPLRRRRSMPISDPPSYSGLFAGLPPGLKQELRIQPREDEGREKLPAYTNDIFLRAVVLRKMEFSSPGVQAKDRKWRRVLCVLEGTALRVYKCPGRSGVLAIGEWWENTVGFGDPAMDPRPSFGTGGGVLNAAVEAGTPGSALAREIEIARAKKGGEVGQPVLQIESSGMEGPLTQCALPRPQMQTGLSHAVTKSALTFAAQLLKPSGTRHMRSNSEATNGTGPSQTTSEQSRRSSLNITRGTGSGRSTPSMNHEGSSSGHSYRPGGGRSRPVTPGSSRRAEENKMGSKPKEKRDEQELEVIRVYTMQHGESGLGKDYTKRQHVIRVRLEGEQFLLQMKNVENVISWIEGLQSAANVALDLDERLMPAGPMLPRRRRRRRVVN